MLKRKVMTIVGTRPEIIRLSCVLSLFDKQFNHILVHTGQNWSTNLNEIFFADLNLRSPDYTLNVVGSHLGETIGNIISRSYEVMQKEKPEALLILGDTNSCLAAIAAKRLKIPIFHMEAGNRCFDLNVPEEINRRIVDHIADVNLPYTEHSRRYLLDEGLPKERIFVTGSPISEVLNRYEDRFANSDILHQQDIEKERYIVVSAHREENVDNPKTLKKLADALDQIANEFRLPLIYSLHPRTKTRLIELNIPLNPNIRCLEAMGYFDYVKLQKNAFCVLSDSGTLSEEAAMLSFPAVLLRTSTERPEVLDSGHIVIGGLDGRDLIQAVRMARSLGANTGHASLPREYNFSAVSEKVARIIESYTKLVNLRVWAKES